MSFPYKNPISPTQALGTISVDPSKVYGTNFSTLSVGGFMEVYSLDQLIYTIPPSTFGMIEFSGNSIPINLFIGSGTPFSQNTITLNPDNISSGRRKLGMLVYVREQDQIYQYNIDNYFNLFSAATASTGTVVISSFGTTIKGNTLAGTAFINAWTANTIDGVGGFTSQNAVWKKYYGTSLAITGGSFNTITSTLTLTNITGGTQSLTGFGTGGGGGSTITGGTFDKNTETLTLSSSGSSITITGFTDVYVTGGTFNSGTGTATFTNNTGGTFNVIGFSSGGGSFTGGTVSGATRFTNGVTANTLNVTGLTTNYDVNVTNNLTALTFVNSNIQDSLTQPSISTENRQLIDTNGLTSVDWELRSTYDTASTLSLDYGNRRFYDSDGFLSIKYKERKLVNSSGVEWLDWQTGTIDTFSTIKSSTISATTYQNLPTDIRVTGSTYSNNTLTFRNNTGGTFSVLFNTFTGGTFNGNLSVTGTTSSGTISATTYQNLPSQSGTGVSSLSYVPTTGVLTLTKNDTTTLTAGTFTYLTGASYSNNTITLTNNLGSTSSVNFNIFTGVTINGNLSVTGTTSSGTISATTYQNLPTDIRVTGSTYSNNTLTFTNNTGGTFNVLFNTFTGGTFNGNLSVTGTTSSGTISATTYQNLPTDIRVTGATYSNNTFTYTNNTGGTFSVLFNTLTGATVNGNLTITGTTQSSIFSGTTISGGTFYGNSSNVEGLSITNILLTQFFS